MCRFEVWNARNHSQAAVDLRDRGKIIGVVTLLALEASHEFVRMSGCGRYGWKNNLKIELRRFFPLSEFNL